MELGAKGLVRAKGELNRRVERGLGWEGIEK